MTRCMSGRINYAHAADDLIAFPHHHDLVLDVRDMVLRTLGNLLLGARGGQLVHRVGARPYFPRGRRNDIARVRIKGVIVRVEDAPEMIGMAGGEYNLGDGRRLDAGSSEIFGELPRRGLVTRATACVD